MDVAILEIGWEDGWMPLMPSIRTLRLLPVWARPSGILGETREAIGAEKAGILRSGQHVVLGQEMPASVMQRCRRYRCSPGVGGRVLQHLRY